MNVKQAGVSIAMAMALSLTLVSCGPKDPEVKANVETAIASPGVMVSVEKGVATLSGTTATEEEKMALEAKAKDAKGVKSVSNMITVAPVEVSPDVALNTAVQAVVGHYKGLMANVQGGVVTLTGEVMRADLPKVMAAISATNPGKVENKATVK